MKLMLEKLVFVSALLSALSFCSIKTAFAQNTGMPSPIDGIPIETNIPLGFGDDNRTPMRSSAYPWSAVGQVQTDGRGHCTGALISRDLVLTNAHCIWKDGQRRGITFAPNYRNGQSPETVRGIHYWWGTSDPSSNRGADWAIIRLERPIGDRYGSFGWQPLNYQELKGRSVNYLGYSVFKTKKLKSLSMVKLHKYTLDVEFGMSFPMMELFILIAIMVEVVQAVQFLFGKTISQSLLV